MKSIKLQTKDNLQTAYINYVEPEDLDLINSEITSYINRYKSILENNLSDSFNEFTQTTYSYIYELNDEYNNKFDDYDKRIHDLSVMYTYTISYSLTESETDHFILNKLIETDERLSYALKVSYNSSINHTQDNLSRINELRDYIDVHINEVNNIKPSEYWINY